MIAFLERSSSSEDDNHDHEHEEGGRRSSSRNKSQLHSMCYPLTKVQRHFPSHLHSPNKTQRTLPSRGTVHHLFSFSAPSPGLVVVLVPIRRKSRTRGRKEKNRSIRPHQARLLPYAYACTYRLWLALFICTYRVSVRFYCIPIPINRHPFAICFSSFWVAIPFHSHSVRSSPN